MNTPPQTKIWDGTHLLAAWQAAAQWLNRHTAAVNALNVFPVPDGDTGTNMALTMNGAVEDVAPQASCTAVAEQVGYNAMMRGRGNSGIILSQVLRGWARGLAGATDMDGTALANALAEASNAAAQAVLKPVEGTILTVIREASAAARDAAHAGGSVVAVLEAATRQAQESVQRTPTLLPALHEAGVVDSGAYGLQLILEGMLRYAHGESLEAADTAPTPASVAFADIHGPDDFGYCTNFVLSGTAMPFETIRAALAAMGQSVVVVGDAALIKAHLHLLRPGDALNYAVDFGTLSNIEITNMDVQRAALQHDAPPAASTADDAPAALVGVVMVTQGAGFAAIARSFHAGAVVDGGPTMNPSTADLLEAVARLPQPDVIILPNNRNVIMAAQQAAHLSDKNVAVVPSRTLPQGIAALVRQQYQMDLQANVQAMTAALDDVLSAEITTAARDATVEGQAVRAGQTIGVIDGALVVADDSFDGALDALLQRMNLVEREIVTVYYGAAAIQADAEALAEHIQTLFPDLGAVEVHNGGQAVYHYILSAE